MTALRTALPFAFLFASVATAEEPARRWGLPVEIFETEGNKGPVPVELVRTASGACGVFVFSKSDGLKLYWSKDGLAPWKPLSMPFGLAGDARVDGERVEIVISDFKADSAAFVAFDFRNGQELERHELPGSLPSLPMFSNVVGSGKDRFVLVGCEKGEAMVYASGDGGVTWKGPVQAAACSVRDDAVAAPLFLGSDGLHVVAVVNRGEIRHAVSADRGETWSDGAAITLPEKYGPPVHAAGAQSGRNFHVVFLTLIGDYVHVGSDNEGKTWGKPVVVARGKGVNDLARIFHVDAEGSAVAFCVSESGKSKMYAKKARVYLSGDGGMSWVRTPVGKGVSGDSGRAAIFLGDGGEAWATVAVSPGEGIEGSHYVLFRRLLPAGAAPEELPEGAPAPPWWGDEK